MRTQLVVLATLLVLDLAVAGQRYPGPSPNRRPARPVPRVCGLFWGAAAHLNRCGRNEVCRRGSLTCGEKKCWLANAPGGKPHLCTADNTPRCFCRRGTWRTTSGKCVRLSRCFKK
uniref:Putative tick til 4 n=1 Tax=Amblyomma parvum TaxID=251391 RepID=A0A023FSJ7_AMBPA